jgi:hypothetical protein
MSFLHYTSGLEQSYHGTTCRSALPRAGWSSSTLTTLRSIFDGLHESFVAYRAYHRLTARGLPHDAAIREALGLGREPAPVARQPARALCFAGKA